MDQPQKLLKSRRILKNNPVDLAQQLKFKQNIVKRKNMIEKLFKKSVPNQIYTFPRLPQSNQSLSSNSSASDIPEFYQLKTQNKKNKSYQANFQQSKTHRAGGLKNRALNYHSVKSLANESHNEDINQIFQTQYHSKKRTKQRTTQKNKSQKIFLNTCSIGKSLHKKRKSIEGSRTKPIVITFRGTKKHDINVSLTRKRIRTEIF